MGVSENMPTFSEIGETAEKKKLVGLCKSRQCNAKYDKSTGNIVEHYGGRVIFTGNNGKTMCPHCGDAIFWKWVKKVHVKAGAE